MSFARTIKFYDILFITQLVRDSLQKSNMKKIILKNNRRGIIKYSHHIR